MESKEKNKKKISKNEMKKVKKEIRFGLVIYKQRSKLTPLNISLKSLKKKRLTFYWNNIIIILFFKKQLLN